MYLNPMRCVSAFVIHHCCITTATSTFLKKKKSSAHHFTLMLTARSTASANVSHEEHLASVSMDLRFSLSIDVTPSKVKLVVLMYWFNILVGCVDFCFHYKYLILSTALTATRAHTKTNERVIHSIKLSGEKNQTRKHQLNTHSSQNCKIRRCWSDTKKDSFTV